MNLNYLDFEQPIAELQQKIEDLRNMSDGSQVSLSEEIQRLEAKQKQLTEQIFSKLEPWQITQLARHPQRPYALDYVERLFSDWEELHGDRAFSDDPAIVSGIARMDGRPVAVIGQQKGRDAKERIHRNFGMPMPEGYRKALRIMKMGEKFSMPVLTFIDTPGAFPGIGAEERNQSEAIARNLLEMSRLRTPIIATVIGEGGSGGALALGVADHVMMLELSIYSVISPEGCASILFKSAERARDAAEAMKITAKDLHGFGLIDEIVSEPLGGAHRDPEAMAAALRESLQKQLDRLCRQPLARLLETRQERLMRYGAFQREQ
jgi:acetyl-CoA carboxylase carboxyl transferase subunit alpha